MIKKYGAVIVLFMVFPSLLFAQQTTNCRPDGYGGVRCETVDWDKKRNETTGVQRAVNNYLANQHAQRMAQQPQVIYVVNQPAQQPVYIPPPAPPQAPAPQQASIKQCQLCQKQYEVTASFKYCPIDGAPLNIVQGAIDH